MNFALADREWIEQRARDAGFDLAGIAAVPESSTSDLEQSDERFAAWIASGHAGEMDYLKDANASGELLRGDLRRPLPWAHSVIVCAVNYNSDAPPSIAPADKSSGWIARYAWSGKAQNTKTENKSPADYPGSDYHDILLPQLRAVETDLHQRFPEIETRCYVDTGPILERGYAARAGIGWIAKNTCVINQQQGSWLLLGVIVTSIPLDGTAVTLPAADRCGTCTRCIDACPTNALLGSSAAGPRSMNASLCIAYLTIEKKGSIPEELRAPMGRQVFGCDICQDVCPWNRRAPISTSNTLPPRRELINPALDWLASLDGLAFNKLFRGSPLQRTRREVSRRKRLFRNVAIAMGNSGEQRFISQLETWSKEEDAALAESAAWAIAQLRKPSAT
jgi:epoxyqueuosine reductase